MGDTDESDDDAGSLKRAFEHVKAMREENGTLRQNFEDLKLLYKECTNKKEQLEAQHAALQQNMERQERHYKEVLNNWREDSEIKQRALEEAQGKIMKPSDLEALKTQIAEQLEAPHRMRCGALEQEAAAAHQQAADARREVERLQLETEAQVARATQGLRTKQQEMEAVVREWEAEVKSLKGLAALHEDAARRGDTSDRQLTAARAENGELLREIEHTRSEKERAVVEKERIHIEAERAAHALRADGAKTRRQLEGQRRRCLHFEQECELAQTQLGAARARVGELEREHQHASAEAERTIHALETAVGGLEEQLEAAAADADEQVRERQAQLDKKEALLGTLEEAHRDQATALTQECASKIEEEEQRQRGLRRALEGEAADLRAAVTALEETARAAAALHASALADARRELDATRREAQESELERAALRAAAAQAKRECEQADSDAVAARQDAAAAAGESAAARERQRETEGVLAETRQDGDRLQQKLARAERQLLELAAVAAAEREELEVQLEIEKQQQYERGRRSGREEAHAVAREAVTREAEKVASLRKKVQQYRKLVNGATWSRGAEGIPVDATWAAGKQKFDVSCDAVRVANLGQGPDSGWYRTQGDMLRNTQTGFLGS